MCVEKGWNSLIRFKVQFEYCEQWMKYPMNERRNEWINMDRDQITGTYIFYYLLIVLNQGA